MIVFGNWRPLTLGLALLLAGCASTAEKAVFRLGLDATESTRKLMWPPQSTGQTPRYFFVGEITGENNFVHPTPPRNTAKGLLERFFDLITGEAPPVQLERPQAGAVDENGRILVSDLNHGAVFVFDEGAGRMLRWDRATRTQPFVTPAAIAIGPPGRVFVSDPDLALVAQLDAQGNPQSPIGAGQLTRPTGLAYDPATQRLFVTDTNAHQVKVFDLEGKLLQTLGGPGEGPGQLNYPTYLAIAHEKLIVSDTLNARVQVFSTRSGSYLGTVGQRGLRVGSMVRPKGVAIDNEHNLYVIESYHDYVLVYNRRGEFLLPIGGIGDGPGNFHLPAGVWVDGRNRIYVADMLNGRVAVFQFLGGDSEGAE